MSRSYDAAIVGARCAGAPLGMLLARQGYNVLLVDRARFPSDTLSTHFLSVRATGKLAEWGLLDDLIATGCPPLRRLRLDFGDCALEGSPDGLGGGNIMLSPRRTILDKLLVDAARESGCEVREGIDVQGLTRTGVRVDGLILKTEGGGSILERARVVIGADGLHSRVAREVGADYREYHDTITGGYFAYWQGIAGDCFEFYMRKDRLVLVFPTHNDETCIWVGWPAKQFVEYKTDVDGNYLDTIELAPDLARRMRGARRVSRYRGANKLPNYYRTCHGPGWALVGDAAHHRDPTTGGGIAEAFIGADLLSKELAASLNGSAKDIDDALSKYEQSLVEETWPFFQYTLRCAAFPDPARLMGFYKALAMEPGGVTRLANVVCGVDAMDSLFNPNTIKRLSAIYAAA